MQKKILVSLLVISLVLMALPLTALGASRYCGWCDKTQSWRACCYGVKTKASSYAACGSNCNYYSVWYRNGEKCPTCTNKVQVAGDHHEKNIHDISSHNTNHCPY